MISGKVEIYVPLYVLQEDNCVYIFALDLHFATHFTSMRVFVYHDRVLCGLFFAGFPMVMAKDDDGVSVGATVMATATAVNIIYQCVSMKSNQSN